MFRRRNRIAGNWRITSSIELVSFHCVWFRRNSEKSSFPDSKKQLSNLAQRGKTDIRGIFLHRIRQVLPILHDQNALMHAHLYFSSLVFLISTGYFVINRVSKQNYRLNALVVTNLCDCVHR